MQFIHSLNLFLKEFFGVSILKLDPDQLVVIDMSELNIFNLRKKIKDFKKVDIFLGSLLDKNFLNIILILFSMLQLTSMFQ